MLHVCLYKILLSSRFAQKEQEILSHSLLLFRTKTHSFPYQPLFRLSPSSSTSRTMRFLQLLPFVSLALAIPNPNSNTKRQSSCTSEAWAIQQYHTCTNCTYPGSTQETTSLVFNFADPNFNPAVTATCELSLLPGSSLTGFNYIQCGAGVAFYYDGADLNVERTGVKCGK